MFCWPVTSCLTAFMVLVKNKFSALNHLLKVLHHQFKRLLYVEQEKKGRSLQGGLSEVRSRFDTWSVLVLQRFLDKAHVKPCPVILEIRTDISWFGGGEDGHRNFLLYIKTLFQKLSETRKHVASNQIIFRALRGSSASTSVMLCLGQTTHTDRRCLSHNYQGHRKRLFVSIFTPTSGPQVRFIV